MEVMKKFATFCACTLLTILSPEIPLRADVRRERAMLYSIGFSTKMLHLC
ncbi:hypothetical protein KFK09_001177 [Dendrobium nobile]|uniref:Uncharacterized protein n=1 Tax=Dendrobium nobile TaxID=94219 RepID=A0A8T3CA42_DENNO|nr:hypothetical protein KFK09_001177 [Dendrobium nobile]